MDNTLVILIIFVIYQIFRPQIFNLLRTLGKGFHRAIVVLGLIFARLVGGYFYLLLIFFDFPSWLLSFISSPDPSIDFKQYQLTYRSTHPSFDRSGKWDGENPEHWTRIVLCNTDDISELDLDLHLDGANNSDLVVGKAKLSLHQGSWERRAIMAVTRAEICRRVMPWLNEIADFESNSNSDSGYQSQEDIEQESPREEDFLEAIEFLFST